MSFRSSIHAYSQQFKNQLSLPAFAAPMFLASGPELVIENCKAGVIGSFPSLNQRDAAGFEEWLIKIKAALATYVKETGKAAEPARERSECIG